MKTLLTALATALSLALAPLSHADVIVPTNLFDGACSVGTGCLFATPTWSTQNATVTYDVDALAGGLYRYEYTFSAEGGLDFVKAISHILLELSANITDENFNEVITSHSAIDAALVEDWNGQGNSNPGIPGSLYGIKFTDQGNQVSFFLESTRIPVWGDFYAKDGTLGGPGTEVYAYNSGFGTDPASGALGVNGWIPVPDTVGTPPPPPPPPPPPAPVPFPGALVLLGAGLFALSIRRFLN